MLLIIALFIVVFLLLIKPTLKIEGFTGRCPNVLMKYKGTYYLYDRDAVYVPGVNPVRLTSLEEYTEVMEWMRSRGIQCPVLEVDEMNGADGSKSAVVALKNASDKIKGKTVPLAYDPLNQEQGERPTGEYEVGTDPMKPDWKGPEYTRERILAGDFDADKVYVVSK